MVLLVVFEVAAAFVLSVEAEAEGRETAMAGTGVMVAFAVISDDDGVTDVSEEDEADSRAE